MIADVKLGEPPSGFDRWNLVIVLSGSVLETVRIAFLDDGSKLAACQANTRNVHAFLLEATINHFLVQTRGQYNCKAQVSLKSLKLQLHLHRL